MAEHTSTLFEEIEQWRPVVGYEGWYSISSLGRVRRDKAGPRATVGHILNPVQSRVGYLRVHLSMSQVKRILSVHQLVAGAFIGPCPDGLQVNHRNGVKTDNRLANLEYVTRSENIRHAVRTGLHHGPQGEKCATAKLNADQVREIRNLRGKMKGVEIARLYGISPMTVSSIQLRTHWKHIA